MARLWSSEKRGILIAGLVTGLILAFVLLVTDIDLIGWIREVQRRIARVPIEFVLFALVFKTLESLLTALSWRNILQATYPATPISFSTVLGGFQGGLGINAVAPAQAGTFAMVGMFRLFIPGSAVPTLFAAFAVNQLAFGFFGVLIFALLFLAQPDALSSWISLLRPFRDVNLDSVILMIAAGIALAGLLVIGGRMAHVRLQMLREQIKPASAILRNPTRYFLYVFVPASLAFACRWVVTGTFLMAFHIPVSLYTILLVLASTFLSGLIQVTPGGIGTKQALNAIALRNYASADVATAYSLTQDVFTIAFNVGFGILTMAWAFGWAQTRALISQRHEIAEQAREPAPGNGNE